jgi:hypothetical protein
MAKSRFSLFKTNTKFCLTKIGWSPEVALKFLNNNTIYLRSLFDTGCTPGEAALLIEKRRVERHETAQSKD